MFVSLIPYSTTCVSKSILGLVRVCMKMAFFALNESQLLCFPLVIASTAYFFLFTVCSSFFCVYACVCRESTVRRCMPIHCTVFIVFCVLDYIRNRWGNVTFLIVLSPFREGGGIVVVVLPKSLFAAHRSLLLLEFVCVSVLAS